DDLHGRNNIKSDDYVNRKSRFQLKNSIILVHSRKLSTYYYILNKLFFLNIKLIYISHSIYDNLRIVTFYPRIVVSISDKVTENLINYFNVSPERIVKINTGIPDRMFSHSALNRPDPLIDILYAARITDEKRQVDIVKNLKGKLNKSVRISFAGTGPDENHLKQLIEDDLNFRFLGFIADIDNIIEQCDYMMLFSKREGLPISLMEGIRASKPLIVNDVGGNLELGEVTINAFVANDWDELLKVINNLPKRFEEQYANMARGSREKFQTKFRYEMMIDKYTSLIKEVYNME
ncbi:MAG TPA: hypothetical protein DHU90_08885, partial [Sphingobacterium sp.]|nr:hypothetical protein [Sphingobacterium sp.]